MKTLLHLILLFVSQALCGDGPYLLDSANNPIKPHWY